MPRELSTGARLVRNVALHGRPAERSLAAHGRRVRGTVTEATVTEPAAHGFDEAAQEAVRRFRFAPALRGGQPVKARLRLSRNWAQSYVNIELRQAVPIAERWALQGVLFSDIAAFERIEASGARGQSGFALVSVLARA